MNTNEFQLRRLKDKLKTLTDDQKRVNQKIFQSRRNEQFELENIRLRFTARARALEDQQKHISKEMERRERELQALQNRIRKEQEEEMEENAHESSTYSHHTRGR